MKGKTQTPTVRTRYSLQDMISAAKFSLIHTGYSDREANSIIRTLFTGMALECGGQGFYLPKDKKMQEKLSALE